MTRASLPFACEVEVRAGEEFRLPEEMTKRLQSGRWLITMQPANDSSQIQSLRLLKS